jgi:hypothetical protein
MPMISYAMEATPVPESPYPEATSLKWLFPQERATLHNAGKGYINSGTGLAMM